MVKVGSKVEVVEMEQESFRKYREHLHKLYTERNKTSDSCSLDFASAAWFKFGRGEKILHRKLVVCEHPNDVWIQQTYDVSKTSQCVSFKKRRGVQWGIYRLASSTFV